MTHREWPPNVELSRWIASHFPSGYRGHAVDVGASDGISISSTYWLEKERLWTVLCVEPNPIFHPRLKQLRAFVSPVALDAFAYKDPMPLHVYDENPEAYSSLRPSHPDHPVGEGWSEQMVKVTTLNLLLAQHEFPKLDALCVDVEGTEDDVLAGIDLARWKPRAVVVESWEEGGHDGLLVPLGYERRWRTADNDCYSLKENA